MAASQFVIAGRVDCERYARLEAAADYFQSRLPSFRVHKEPQTALEWPCYLRRTCAAQGWHLPADTDGPLVWRLLVQRGGRGLLVGGLSEFLQFAAVYYGLTPPELSPLAARQMAAHTAGQFELERKQRRQARVALERRLTVVSVLGSPLSEAAYHFLATLATGSVLGESVLLRLQLLGDPADPALAALRCELLDLASPQLGQVALLPSVREAVRSATVIIILDPIPNVPPPEPTPPPTPPPEEPPPPPPPPPPPADRPRSAGDGERTSSSEATPPTTPPARDSAGSSSPTSPQITTTPPDEDRLPGDLAPGRGSRGGSARRSGDSRKLSIIVEDPDSEEKEEEALEQLMASRGGSSSSSRRSGRYRSPNASSAQQRRKSKVDSDPAADPSGKVKAEGSTAAAGGTPPGSGTAADPAGAGGGGSGRPAGDSSSDRETDADGWLEPPSDVDDDTEVSLQELAELFCRMREYACAIDATAAARCRVLVAGGRMPCLAATMVLLHLPRLPRSNVIAVCQPRTNQLRALIAERLGVAAHDIHGLAEWGNPPAGRCWLDLDAAAVSRHQGAVRGPAGYRRPLLEVLHQRQWLADELPRLLAERTSCPLRPAGAELSALPLAVCVADTLRRWWAGADDGRLETLGVASEGEFGVPLQLVLAAPVRLIAGEFRVCRSLPLYGEGAAAVRAAVDQAIGWLWRFGVRLSASGHQCTLSACPSSTVTCCGSGERLPSDAERSTDSAEKPADSPPTAGAEGDGGAPAEPQPPTTEESDGKPSETTAAEEPPPPPPEDTKPPAAEETPNTTDQAPAELTPAEETPAPSDSDRPLTGGSRDTPDDVSSGEQRRQSETPRRASLTAEGERGYIPVQGDP